MNYTTRSDLIKIVAKSCNVAPAAAAAIIDEFMLGIIEALREGDVRLKEFGNFKRIKIPAHMKIIPTWEGVPIERTVPDRVKVKFVPSPWFLKEIQDGETSS
jgi:nucleoid DNA-binding protein